MSGDSSDNLNDVGPRDSRLESFLREAGGILASDKQWAPETRVKLRALADRLKLPADVFQKALDELSNPTRIVPQTRWEVAYIEYLEIQFQKLPGRILSLPQERKALNYGQRKFQLSIENCEHWLTLTAQRLEIARISDSDAIAHAQAEVQRLSVGQLKYDASLEERVVAAVKRWGVEPKQARRLLESQLATNRSKIRKKRLRLLTLQVGSVALGVFLIVAMFVLARVLLPQLEPEKNKIVQVQTDPPLTDVEAKETVGTAVFPEWWTDAAKQLAKRQMQSAELVTIVTQLVTNDAKIRTDGYENFLRKAVDEDGNNFAASPEASRWLRQPLVQQAIVDWFVNEPNAKAAYDLVKLLKFQRSQLSEMGEADSIEGLLFRFLELNSVNTILIRMEVEATQRPDNANLRTAIESQLPDFGMRSWGVEDVPAWSESVQRSMLVRGSRRLCQRLKSQWLVSRQRSLTPSDLARIESECRLVLANLRTVSDEPVRNRIMLDFITSVAGFDVRLGTAFLPELKSLLANASANDLETATELFAWIERDLPFRAELASSLRELAPNKDFVESGVLIRDLLTLQRKLNIKSSVNVVGTRIRTQFVSQEIEKVRTLMESKSDWRLKDWSQMLDTVSLSVALLESRWNYDRFDQLVLKKGLANSEGSAAVETVEAKQGTAPSDQVVQQAVEKLAQAEDDIRKYEDGVKRIVNFQQQGFLLSQRQWKSVLDVVSEDLPADKQVSWQLVFPALMKQANFVLAIADFVQSADELKQKRLSELAADTRNSNGLPVKLSMRLEPEKLRIRALQQMQLSVLRQSEMLNNASASQDLALPSGAQVRARFNRAMMDRLEIFAIKEEYSSSLADGPDKLLVDLIRRTQDVAAESFDFPFDAFVFPDELTNVLLLHETWSLQIEKRYGISVSLDFEDARSFTASGSASLFQLRNAEFSLLQRLERALAKQDSGLLEDVVEVAK